MIKTIELTKTFTGKDAVAGLNLDIPEGEFFCILGPNAAGKTTTIKMLTGLLKPTSGQIFIGGRDITKTPSLAKSIISYIPDTPFLYDKLTALEFLEFISDIYEIKNKNRIPELLEQFGLMDSQNILIENFSHGMKQRLTFCAAFIHEPKVIIIDEPMVGLDPHAIKIVKTSLKEKSRSGATIFMSTHTLPICEELADRIGILNNGLMAALGTYEEIRQMENSPESNLEEIFLKLTTEKAS
jgi:ABC-2 type transport system ATP-binding protein